MNIRISTSQDQPTAIEKLNNKIINAVQSKISKKEMRMYLEYSNAEDRNQIALILNILRKDYGFTAEQLRGFYLKADEANGSAMSYTLQMLPVPEIASLKEYGVDIEALEKEYISGEEDV